MAIQDLTASLDLKQNLNIFAACKQFDSMNLILSIYDNSLQADLSNYNVRLRAMKADKVPLIQEHVGITISTNPSNIVTIEADEQLTTTAGKTPIELQFIDNTTGKKKATFNLVLIVFPSTVNINGTISTATYTLLEKLENKLDQASDFFENIDTAIETNNTLETTISSANTTKTNLDGSISTGDTLKTNLDNTISTGNTLKNNLESDISAGNTLKTNLDSTITTGDNLLDSLETFEQEHSDVTDISNQLSVINTSLSEKANNTDNDRTTISKTVTGAINELNTKKANKTDLDSTNSNVASNTSRITAQENKKISQADITAELLAQITGTTLINAIPSDYSITSRQFKKPMVIGTASKNLFDKSDINVGYYVSYTNGSLVPNSSYTASNYIPISANTDYSASYTGEQYAWYDANKNYISGGTVAGNNMVSPANACYIRFSMETANLNSVQLEKGAIATSYQSFNPTVSKDILHQSSLDYIDDKRLFYDYRVNNYWGYNANGAVIANNQLSVPSGSTGNGAYLMAQSSLDQWDNLSDLVGKTIKLYLVIKQLNTNKSLSFNMFVKRDTDVNNVATNIKTNTISDAVVVVTMEYVITANDIDIRPYVQITGTDTTEYSLEISEIKYIVLDRTYKYSSAQDALEKKIRKEINIALDNPIKTILEVSKDYTPSTKGWGVTKFSDLITAHNSISNSSITNQYLIRAHPGEYNEWETVFATYNSSVYYTGILVKDYVYFESTDIEHPENYILKWDGHAGHAEGTKLTKDEAMQKCLFHIVNYPSHTYIKGFTLQAKNARYCIHPESAGTGYGNEWLIENCIFDWQGCPDVEGYTGVAVGIGISTGDTGAIKNCKFKNVGDIWGHNNGWDTTRLGSNKPFVVQGANLTVENCDMNGNNITMATSSNDATTFDVLNIVNCKHVNGLYSGLLIDGLTQNWKANIIASQIVTNNF